jgi:trans-aconitate methyltransferase
MSNPWLRIPANDYERHMSSPNVDQLSFLARTFKESVESHDASAIALLGCATGNGLQYVDGKNTRRVTAVDINPEYLGILRQRYERHVPGLETVEADLEKCELDNRAYSLVFAGLVFEYLDPRILIMKIAGWLHSGGIMVAVLQLQTDHSEKVTDTPYTSLKLLEPVMKLVSQEELKAQAGDAGFRDIKARTVTLKSGKSFYTGTYVKE